MGLFNFRKKQQLLNLQKIVVKNSPDRLVFSEAKLMETARLMADNDLKIINDCVRLVNTTVNPDVFFKRLDLLIQHAQHLTLFEPYISFLGSSPTNSLNNIIEKQNASIWDFLNRYYDDVYSKISIAKSEKTKIKHFHKFYNSLTPYYHRIQNNHIQFIESKKQYICTILIPNTLVVYYKNGNFEKVIPDINCDYYENRDIFYQARYINSDGTLYDLKNSKDIASIKVPTFDDYTIYGATFTLDYILRMKASNIRQTGDLKTSTLLLKKAHELMQASKTMWTKNDYMRIVQWLQEDGDFDEAEKYMIEIDKIIFNLNQSLINISLSNARRLGTDLVEAGYFLGCCPECAKYRGRIFSISGKDKRFPKMPENYKCTCQGIEFSPFIYGVDEPMYYPKNVNIIEYSNRPFIDNRTKQEKLDHSVYKKEIDNENWFEQYSQRVAVIVSYDKARYGELQKILPTEAPKSYSGYKKMKNSNSKNYQKLVSLASDYGINLNYPPEMQEEYNKLAPIIQEYNRTKSECNQYWQERKNNK